MRKGQGTKAHRHRGIKQKTSFFVFTLCTSVTLSLSSPLYLCLSNAASAERSLPLVWRLKPSLQLVPQLRRTLEIHDPPGLQDDSFACLGVPSFSGPLELDSEFSEAGDQKLIAPFKGFLDDFKGCVHELGGASLGHLRVTELREEELLFCPSWVS